MRLKHERRNAHAQAERRQGEVFGCIPHGRGALSRNVFSNRRISMNMTTTFRRGVFVLACTMLAGSVLADKDVPSAWRNTVDARAAEEAMCAYTSNVIRCEWAGENPNVAKLMPANLAFQFAFVGDSDVTNRVQKVLREVADAINPTVRVQLEKYGLLNSTLQWIVRVCRPGITNYTEYLSAKAHPAVFKESDLDVRKLKEAASQITSQNIPLPVMIRIERSKYDIPLSKAFPEIDYPDVLPEETFTLPVGSALVLRAPERKRRFRLSAQTYPIECRIAKFKWVTTGHGKFYPWSNARGDMPEDGHVDFVCDTIPHGPRLDVLVFAQLPNGMIGPPSVLSIYRPPLMLRKYTSGQLQSISYLGKSKDIPYDISPIWIPHEWKDEYSLNSGGQILSFTRSFPDRTGEECFSAIGELVDKMSPSGYPLSARKVKYFVSPESGKLEYRAIGDEIKYRLGNPPYRRSGE